MLAPTSWRPPCAPPTHCCGRCSACATTRTDAPGTWQRDVDPHGWLSGSPLNHTAVYQATGMILAQLQVSPGAALSGFRAYAFVHDRTILEVARDVVHGG